MSPRHLLIVAAGTGGHVIPGLAVAAEVQRRGWTVSWLGTTTGMENKLVPPSGIAMDTVAFTGLRGKGLAHTLGGVLRLFAALVHCAQVIRRRRAHVVLGMGGYLCFPAGLMAALLRKPLMLVNADAALLLSNRALLPVAGRIAFGFDGPAAHDTRCRCRRSALPVARGRCACWWSAAAWARRCSTAACRWRWRCCPRASVRR